MFKCIKEGTAEWACDVKGMLGVHFNIDITKLSFKSILHFLFATGYMIVAGLVSIMFLLIPAHFMSVYDVGPAIGIPLLFAMLFPALWSGMWFINVWFACKRNAQ